MCSPDPPFLPGNSYGQKTRPGRCPEQELIAQRTLDDKSGRGGLLAREIPIFIGSLWAILPGRTAIAGKPGEQCAVCESCNALAGKVLREVVDSTVGDVVQLVRTLPPSPRSSKTLPLLAFAAFVRQDTQAHNLVRVTNVSGLSTCYSFKRHFVLWRGTGSEKHIRTGSLCKILSHPISSRSSFLTTRDINAPT